MSLELLFLTACFLLNVIVLLRIPRLMIPSSPSVAADYHNGSVARSFLPACCCCAWCGLWMQEAWLFPPLHAAIVKMSLCGLGTSLLIAQAWWLGKRAAQLCQDT